MCKKLEIPLTTIQRRRKRLEKEFLENDYTLLLEKFGWRRVDFFISTTDGKTDALANDLSFYESCNGSGKEHRRTYY